MLKTTETVAFFLDADAGVFPDTCSNFSGSGDRVF
jgi:hypothetical protein